MQFYRIGKLSLESCGAFSNGHSTRASHQISFASATSWVQNTIQKRIALLFISNFPSACSFLSLFLLPFIIWNTVLAENSLQASIFHLTYGWPHFYVFCVPLGNFNHFGMRDDRTIESSRLEETFKTNKTNHHFSTTTVTPKPLKHEQEQKPCLICNLAMDKTL